MNRNQNGVSKRLLKSSFLEERSEINSLTDIFHCHNVSAWVLDSGSREHSISRD